MVSHTDAINCELAVEDLGRLSYDKALVRQRELHAALVQARSGDGQPGEPMTLLLVEHDPVITVSQRPGAAEHLLASREQLEALGITVASTDRGGDITYHGPGQLVVYPILDLRRLSLGVSQYIRLLEEVIIQTLGSFGITANRETGATGVWVADSSSESAEKIGAIGVRVARWVTMHGLALNVTTNLAHFDVIVPCGLAGCRVTSMARLMGDDPPTMEHVKSRLVDVFCTLVDQLPRENCEAAVAP